MLNHRCQITSRAVLVVLGLALPVGAQTAGMQSFQGLIRDELNEPIDSPVDLQFRIFDSQAGGALVDMDGDGSVEDVVGEDAKQVNGANPLGSSGIVATKFGPVAPGAFSGGARWLEVRVSPAGQNTWSTLSRVEMATPPATAEQLNARGTGNPAVVALPNGNVGIGTSSPENTLHIHKGSAGILSAHAFAPLIVENSSHAYINILAPDATETGILFGRPGATNPAIAGAIIFNTVGQGLDGLNFRTGGNVIRMVINSIGNVGIGTTSPSQRLHVAGNGTFSGNVTVGSFSTNGAVVAVNPNNANASVNLNWSNNVARIRISGFGDGSGNGFDIQRPGDVSALRILGNGNVGIGTTSPSNTLHVVGGACKTSGGTAWSTCSDKRLKKNIQPLDNALSRLLALRGSLFEWRDPSSHGNETGPQMGFIAQQIENVFPHWVRHDAAGMKYVGPAGLEALTVEAIRELKKENDSLRVRVDRLERRLELMERAIARKAK